MSRSISGRRRIVAFAATLAVLPAAWLVSPAAHAAAPPEPTATAAVTQQSPDSGVAVHHDTSPPLRSMHAAKTGQAGHSYTLTLTSKDDNYTGDATYTTYDDVTLS